MTTPSLQQVLERVIAASLDRQRGPMVASVELYNAAVQTVDVKPLVQVYVDGQLVDLPVVRNVPVAFPQGGGTSITWPLVPGDVVYLVPAEGDLGAWHASAVRNGPPPSKRRLSLSDMVAIPGIASMAAPLPATAYDPTALVLAATQLKLGSSAATDFVALASLVLAQLQAIKTAFDTHTHTGVTTGAGASGPPAVPMPAPSSPAAAKVRAE